MITGWAVQAAVFTMDGKGMPATTRMGGGRRRPAGRFRLRMTVPGKLVGLVIGG